MAEKIRDIIILPDIKLVVELDDAERDSEGILSSFVLTDVVQQGLDAIVRKIIENKGCGIFIKGNFGSGKSHFLSYLYLLLRNKRVDDLKDKDFKITKISLVKYPSYKSLEDIVLDSLNFKERRSNRTEEFKEIVNRPTIIIIDELSEFLRSKPTPSSFYEDVRFLQFLGEFSFHYPLWVIASLQEWIEETGHISSSIFNRIKDRYPLRLNLTASHIEDIIDRRIIIKQQGADVIIRRVFDELRRYYPNLPIKYEDFRKTYPLHPFAVRYLGGLTQIFSQQRGVIHFVYSETQKILDSHLDTLITPDRIFDHFEDRIREMPEFSVFARVVLDYYKAHINEIFTKQSVADTAINIIKLMILTELTPLEKRKTAKEIAELALNKISTLTSQINYDFIENGILAPLVSHQMYIRKEQDIYYIDASIDEGIKIKGQIKRLRERFEDKSYLFTEICNLTMLPHLPLKDLSEGKKYKINWQNSLRDCVVILATKALFRTDIERIIQSLEKRLDFYLIIISPFIEQSWIHGLRNSLSSRYLTAVAFWVPTRFKTDEEIFIEEFTAKNIISKDIPLIRNEIKKDEAIFREIITRIYFEGEIIYGDGSRFESLKDTGLIPIERLLAHIADIPLTKIYPYHYRVMPKTDFISTYNLNLLFYNFIRQGKITIEDADKKGLTSYIKSILEPLGIVSKRGKHYIISLDVTNELINYVLDIVSHEDNLFNIRLSLKKGSWGLTDEQINLILSAIIVSGYLVLYSAEEPFELKDLQQLSSGEITKVRRGKIISHDLLSHIHKGAFIWGETEDIPTPLTQKTMWTDAISFIRQKRSLLEEINGFIARYKDYTIFKKTSIDMPLLSRMSIFLNSINFSLSPSEGLEKILIYLAQSTDMENDFAYLQRLHLFFNDEFHYLNKYYLYLAHPSLTLPDWLEDKRTNILIRIEEILKSLTPDFHGVKEIWEEFYTSFLNEYREGHDKYYQADIFNLRNKILQSKEIEFLKKIAHIVTSVTFQWEWWQIKREIDKLPEACKADIAQELFSNPICKCGYKIGDKAPVFEVNLLNKGSLGIFNFISTIKSPENKEKLDSFILGVADVSLQGSLKKIHQLLNLNLEKTNTTFITQLLTDDTLELIEKVFRGRWKIKELKIEEFTDKVKGRRFKYPDIKNIMLQWLGNEEESIIHIIDDTSSGEAIIREELAKYGVQGERLYIDLSNKAISCKRAEELEEIMKETGTLEQLDSINMSAYETDELFAFLKVEKIEYLKKKIREELFFRLKDKTITKEITSDIHDETMIDLLEILRIIGEKDRYKGVKIFTHIIAPAEYLMEKLSYKALSRDFVDKSLIEYLLSNLRMIKGKYEKDKNRHEGARDTSFIKETIEGPVIILDGLRYDLWCLLREILEKNGWQLKEESFVITAPSITANFRQAIGIEGREDINGKRFKLMTFAEKNFGKREIRRFLKGEEEIKFLHFNFIDTKIHDSTLDLYPLYTLVVDEFREGIIPILKEIGSFYLVSDHGFIDTKNLKGRYIHGKGSTWETILPFVRCLI